MATEAEREARPTGDGVRTAIYTRVSTDDQASADKVSLSDQEERCRAFAESHGWTVVDTFSDEGVSGATAPAERPAFAALLAAKPDAILAYALDRVVRDEHGWYSWRRASDLRVVTLDG